MSIVIYLHTDIPLYIHIYPTSTYSSTSAHHPDGADEHLAEVDLADGVTVTSFLFFANGGPVASCHISTIVVLAAFLSFNLFGCKQWLGTQRVGGQAQHRLPGDGLHPKASAKPPSRWEMEAPTNALNHTLKTRFRLLRKRLR